MVVITVALTLWVSPARAFVNAIISQDLPILVEIAATEAASYTELGAILAEAAAITAEVKEYTSLAKTAWGAIEELRQMTWEDLARAAKQGAFNAFPELRQMYGDIDDIRDLNYRDPKALDTLRGMLWEGVYGPGIDYLHSAHENFEAVSRMQEHRMRQTIKVTVRRMETEQWEEDCKRTSANGGVEGACEAAANRAAIQSALMLADLHETTLYALDAQERLISNEDRKELDDLYAYDRWVFDARNYFATAVGIDQPCTAGSCLHERYSDAMWRRVQEFRLRHPVEYPQRIDPHRISAGDTP